MDTLFLIFLVFTVVVGMVALVAGTRMWRRSGRLRRRAEDLCLRMNALISREDITAIESPVLPGEERRSALPYLISRMQDHVSAIKALRGIPDVAQRERVRSAAMALTQLALDIELLEMGAMLPVLPPGHRICCECWGAFKESDLIPFSDFHVCGDCKERILQKIKEGVVTEL